ncbi:hypothetical protein NHX12_004652 [Muraenolepis orangiensis]|uniref:Uncharacterized protein n=1 Tax=Muraenolepis orangiensis TaxID=630683 RepID=A0A9Q0IET2_9TELE|nr:hypothetical protein NHX12_004652 [Muraenolepis orangiensis]
MASESSLIWVDGSLPQSKQSHRTYSSATATTTTTHHHNNNTATAAGSAGSSIAWWSSRLDRWSSSSSSTASCPRLSSIAPTHTAGRRRRTQAAGRMTPTRT